VFELTSLQDLTLSCYGQSGLLQHLPALVHFTRLVIDSPAGSEEMSTVDTDLAWRKLRNLQHVSVCHHMIAFGQGIFDLVELPNLQKFPSSAVTQTASQILSVTLHLCMSLLSYVHRLKSHYSPKLLQQYATSVMTPKLRLW